MEYIKEQLYLSRFRLIQLVQEEHVTAKRIREVPFMQMSPTWALLFTVVTVRGSQVKARRLIYAHLKA